MLAVEVSGSMQARDLATGDGNPVSRLEAGKEVVSHLFRDRANDRIELVEPSA